MPHHIILLFFVKFQTEFLENINACLFFDWKFFVNILLANFGDG